MSEQTPCFHCGLPVRSPASYSLRRPQGELYFCCPGCKAIAQTILDGGLDKFYAYRQLGTSTADTPPRPPEATGQSDFSRYDQAQFQHGFVQCEDDQCTALLTIEGITCAACTWLIEHRLQGVAGITHVHVNQAKHRATISWHSSDIALSKIFTLIDAIGYTPSPYSPDSEEQLLEREQQAALKRLGVAGLGMMQVGMFAIALHAGALQGMAELHRDFLRQVSLIVATAVVFYAARPFFQSAWRNVRTRSLGMDVPVSLAIGLAYGASCWATLAGSGDVYFDSVAMFTFFLLGSRFLEMRARHRNEHISRGLSALQAPYAWRLTAATETKALTETTAATQTGDAVQVPADQLASGDQVLIKPGELVPADGVVISGNSSVDESIFSGEYLPVSKSRGDAVVAGSVNADGVLTVTVSATHGQTRLDLITRLLERAQASKPRSAQLADRLASLFVLLVLSCATVTALFWLWWQPDKALWVALSVLVVSCPCALSLATPTALTAALSALKSRGILLSRGDVLEKLPGITTIVLDKTGTLTTGKLTLHRTQILGAMNHERCHAIAATLERHSNHPIASAFSTDSAALECSDLELQVGYGIAANIAGERYFIGSLHWVASQLEGDPPSAVSTAITDTGTDSTDTSGQPPTVQVALASTQQWLAVFSLHDAIRPGAAAALETLRQRGLQLRMLSGDSSTAVASVAHTLGIIDYSGGMSPRQKLQQIRTWQEQGERVLMIGDGINDVPVLAGADISVAVVNATALAKASADCLLLSGELSGINTLLDSAVRTRRVIKQNLGWALMYNICAMPLAASGYVPPWLAALGMSTSSLVVVANALRLNRHHDYRTTVDKHTMQTTRLPPVGA